MVTDVILIWIIFRIQSPSSKLCWDQFVIGGILKIESIFISIISIRITVLDVQ